MSTLLILASFFSFAQLQFVENKGQWDRVVDFKSDIQNGAFFLQSTGFTVLQQHEKDMAALSAKLHGHSHSSNDAEHKAVVPVSNSLTVRSHAYRVNFLGASKRVTPVADKPLDTYNNYFIGNDKSKWQSGCRLYQAVTYKNMYPNIDVRYYSAQGTLKYDIIVNPGGKVSDIALQYEGADRLSIRNRELIITTSIGETKELYPYTYQAADKGRQTLDCKYVLDKNVVRFKVEDYDVTKTLVIDPTLIFCSFTGSTADNWGYTATPGPDGSFFAGGIVFGSGFPVSPGAFQQIFAGGIEEDPNGPYDIGIIKLSPNGTQRIYATYIGGSGNEQPHSMICDASGNLVIAGRTNSPENSGGAYPILGAVIAPAGRPAGTYDIVVTKLNPTGTTILGSLRMGGSGDDGVNIESKYGDLLVPGQTDGAFDTRRNYGDDARTEVILDGNNNIYLASCTQSSDFPVRGSIFQSTFGGGGSIYKQDGVVVKFDPSLSAVMFSSYFGGSGNDACFVVAVNPVTGNVYVAGATTSPNLPGDKTGVLAGTYQGGDTDGFITEITPDGSTIIKTTYIGTNDNDAGADGNDLVYGIQFDRFGFPYIMGATTGNWVAKNAAFSNTGAKQFIGKLEPDLSAYVYTTMFGTASTIPNISPVAFLVDRCQNVYVSGWGGVFNSQKGYPCAGTTGMNFLITPGAIKTNTDGNDFFFFVLERDAASQLYGTFFGQNGGFTDHVDGGTSRFDENGVIYQAMCANCTSPGIAFPTQPNVWAPQNNSTGCNEAAVKIEMNFSGIGASVKATVNGVLDTVGCVPLTIRFTDTLAKGQRYIWNFGDGSPDTTTFAPVNTVTHTYTSVGVYRLRLVSIDSTTCNIADTAYTTVRVGNNVVNPDFVASKIGGCQSQTFQFVNTTTAARPVYTANSFLWDYGDGSPKVRAGFFNTTHTYASPGTYQVTLVVDDSIFCNAPDTVVKTVRLAVNVTARFTTPENGCQPHTAVFENVSLGGTEWLWDFGDNTTSTLADPPPHVYNNTGTYTIRLTAIDTSTCNQRDDTTITITVYPVPTANFTASPNPGEANRPINFSNSSAGATLYLWDFGDGETSTLANPSHLFNASDTFNVCLVATNVAGCSDTICKPVVANIIPLLDVPNAFTPGKFGTNAVINVQGFGIASMAWNIYNRWGQLVFTTSSRKDGWDGTFKGVLQPMDVYTYTLEVVFTDGKKLRKTGDITLLR